MLQTFMQATYRSVTNTWQWVSQNLQTTRDYLYSLHFVSMSRVIEIRLCFIFLR
jgi:hypothetical protein